MHLLILTRQEGTISGGASGAAAWSHVLLQCVYLTSSKQEFSQFYTQSGGITNLHVLILMQHGGREISSARFSPVLVIGAGYLQYVHLCQLSVASGSRFSMSLWDDPWATEGAMESDAWCVEAPHQQIWLTLPLTRQPLCFDRTGWGKSDIVRLHI